MLSVGMHFKLTQKLAVLYNVGVDCKNGAKGMNGDEG